MLFGLLIAVIIVVGACIAVWRVTAPALPPSGGQGPSDRTGSDAEV
jgi:hypothetical protein